MHGQVKLDPYGLLCHVNYFEADAFARWKNKRLPNEFEWEYTANNCINSTDEFKVYDLFGCLWQWTSSYFTPYPNYKPYKGSLGEYNGKFMSNQIVLRGSSFATPNPKLPFAANNIKLPSKFLICVTPDKDVFAPLT